MEEQHTTKSSYRQAAEGPQHTHKEPQPRLLSLSSTRAVLRLTLVKSQHLVSFRIWPEAPVSSISFPSLESLLDMTIELQLGFRQRGTLINWQIRRQHTLLSTIKWSDLDSQTQISKQAGKAKTTYDCLYNNRKTAMCTVYKRPVLLLSPVVRS